MTIQKETAAEAFGGRSGVSISARSARLAGLFQRLDTPTVDSHLMLSAISPHFRFARTTIRRSRPQRGHPIPEHPGALRRLRKIADCVQGGTTKGIGHVDPETPAIYRSRRKPFLSVAAAPRHRRFPAHDLAAVRR